MDLRDYEQLLGDIKDALAEDLHTTFAIVGHTPVAYDLVGFFRSVGAERRLRGMYVRGVGGGLPENAVKNLSTLADDKPDFVVIASDESKEQLLEESMPYLTPAVKVILAGYGHFIFRDALFEQVVRGSLVPSLANGYPHTLVHLYQCLQNAARHNLQGIVTELGMFKGGTTMLLSRFIEQLGQSWKVIAFETFAGFPKRRSVLDMYAHPGCVFTDEASVRQYFDGRNVEIISGDIVAKVGRLESENVVLAFLDTDNYTPASAALDVIQDRVVVGGAIVFDHFTGRDRFRYTLGERFAAKRLLSDSRYFNLHDTGVFFRQR